MSAEITERQKKLVSIIISKFPEEKKVQLTFLQKLVFLCQEQIRSCNIEYPFEKGHFGPYSPDIVSDVDDLGEKGIIKIGKGAQVIVTIDIVNKWSDAAKTLAELHHLFPDDSSIIVSALTSPNVISRNVGEPIVLSHHR